LHKIDAALGHLDRLIAEGPDTTTYTRLKAAALSRIGQYEDSARLHRLVLSQEPRDDATWIMYGHALRILNKQTEAVAAYREAVAIKPSLGGAWWSLANIKTIPLTDADIGSITTALEQNDLDERDRMALHFALGKALEDKARRDPQFAEAAFDSYRTGNLIASRIFPYSEAKVDAVVAHAKAESDLVTSSPSSRPVDDPMPIFVVGMPRAGSTLIEQILASHSLVEATSELPHMIGLARFVRDSIERGDFPARLSDMGGGKLAELGDIYLERTKPNRLVGRPYFIDKNPNNWMNVDLIRKILPQAKIIDIRRHPLDCGFSNYRQLFARGHEFSYDLRSIGHYYSRYVDLMAHWDRVAPGSVHRIIYEELVDSPEEQIRNLLDALGLEFEATCLSFHENRRSITTPSSEQVQRPINRDGMDRWRLFDSWLAPLRDSLGETIDAYPLPPENSL